MPSTKTQRDERKNKIFKFFRELKESTPCVDCGKKYPHYVMDLDHLPEKGKKVIAVSRMVQKIYSMETIINEIDKCEIVCSNCHRIRTWGGSRKTTEWYKAWKDKN